MVDQPHTEQPPERKAPGKFSSTVLGIGSVTGLALAACSVYLGVMAFKGKGGLDGIGNKNVVGTLAIGTGVGIAATSIAGIRHALFAGIVREANKRDELLLQRASINKELAEHSR